MPVVLAPLDGGGEALGLSGGEERGALVEGFGVDVAVRRESGTDRGEDRAVGEGEFADGDSVHGKRVYNKCKACHLVEESTKKKVGPHLAKIFGRKAASIEGFKYSKAMRKADIVWDEKNLDAFIKKPNKFLKGTK